jgi:hypothetical protein
MNGIILCVSKNKNIEYILMLIIIIAAVLKSSKKTDQCHNIIIFSACAFYRVLELLFSYDSMFFRKSSTTSQPRQTLEE